MKTSDFDYDLPPERIAQEAVEPRDAARVLIASSLDDIAFRDVASLFEAGDCLVVNTTRVRHARLRGTREDTGGKVEVLLTRRFDATRWEAMLRPSRRLGMSARIRVGDRIATLLTDPVDGVATIAIEPPDGVEDLLDAVGVVPLPPYFHGDLPDPERYQTIFAKEVGSAAAPTAALHFTEGVVASLLGKGVVFAEVELRIGLDTFRPMVVDVVADHTMHTEEIVVRDDAVRTVNGARSAGGRIIAVGTTVARTLESVADESGRIDPYTGSTSLFITPGYDMRVVDGLLTNFHAPRTTLLVMIAALMGDRWRMAYDHAIEHGFRFLSFGDAMYIEVDR
ncbi:MAG TPA: tRNA preQ1(34) S-adenosylmethionine ribosyltransferase-isomerase QueA [Acidimicrobiia bacterium]|nr:tRNA preQ1(34) S-adenosylmethionine ribosyltransferase-isomerase QueA [Acidimicrobiia bacterium]